MTHFAMRERGATIPAAGHVRHVRRRPVEGLLALVAFGVALLGFLAAPARGPRLAGPQLATAATARPLPPSLNAYGSLLAPPAQRVDPPLHQPVTSGMLFNVVTGRVLWARRPDRVLPIASLTKMMTALVVVADSRPSDRVLITPAAVHFTGSGVGLLPLGKRVSELALLYGLLLPSGNDAAIALAQHVAGTQAAFVAMMNARARQMNLRCTHFASVSGVVDRGNHSCAADLAVLARAVLDHPLLATIVASHSAILPFPIKGGKLFLYNNNPLLMSGYRGTDGLKTGFTTLAGQCLVATARRGPTWLGVVLLHSADTADEAQTLLNDGFARRS